MFTMYKYIIVLLCGTSQSVWIQPLVIQSNSNSLCVPVGFDLIITCTRNLKQQSAGPEQNITMKKQNQLMDSNMMNIKNGVEALIPNVTSNDTPIYCCLEDDDCVGLNFIIGEPPSAPQDFKCVIYNLTKLECTWTSTDKCVTWSLQYETISSFQNRYAHVNQTQTACDGEGTPLSHGCNKCSDLTKCIRNVWSLETTQLDVVYKFNLTGSGNYGVSTNYYNISTSYVIYKLGDMSNCSSIYNKTSVEIGCKFPPGFPPAGFRYGLRCKIATQYSSHYDIIEYTEGDLHYLLEDTHPYTFYNVSLTCQVNKSLYWGNPFIYQFTTPQDVPLVGPSASNQSYTVWCKAGKLYILIYIQPPNANQTQGILTGYNMTIESPTDCWHKSFLPNKTTLVSSVDVDMCGSSVNYIVTIWSRTNKGDSKEGTQLSVAANATLADMAITEVIVEETSSGYLVSWKGQQHQSKKCVYHWCISADNSEGRTDNVICQEKYNFSETIGRQLLIHLNTDYRWRFGVSQNGTGIRWQDCVFSNGLPIRKPDRLRNESTIELPTSMTFCSKISQKGPKPLEYIVLYSDVANNISNCSTVNASMRTSFKDIRLNADTLYTVKYKIVYSEGRQSEFSDEVLYNTTKKDLSFQVQQTVVRSSGSTTNVWKVAGGIMGAIAFLIIVLILLYTAILRWKNIDDKIEDVSVQPPDITESAQERFETITSKASDSGRGTLSTTKTDLNDDQLQIVNIQPSQGKPQNRPPLPYDIHDGSQTNHGHPVNNVDKSAESEQVPDVTSGAVDSNESDTHSDKVQFCLSDMVGFVRNQNTDYVRIDQFSIISSKI